MSRRTGLWTVIVLGPVSGVVALHGAATSVDPHMVVLYSSLTTVIGAAHVLLVWELLLATRHGRSAPVARWRRPFVLFAASVVTPPLVSAPWPSGGPPVVVDMSTVVSPALAGAALAALLERRRSAAVGGALPRRLADDELVTLAELRRNAQAGIGDLECDGTSQPDLLVAIDPRVDRLLRAAEETSLEERCPDACTDWSGLVRVMGYPEVVDAVGHRATFRKGKSLELLVWLCFNRDRMRRTAARTALWDVDVSDATFATVVSEMRRGLRELIPHMSTDDISRPTYTDAIELSPGILTDFDLLVTAHREFRSGGAPDSLVNALRAVRDVPFAGANYGWADYDGTTTRVVISVVGAAVELADWALAEGDVAAADVALRAGLRTMPDHPDLLEIQARLRQHRVLGV